MSSPALPAFLSLCWCLSDWCVKASEGAEDTEAMMLGQLTELIKENFDARKVGEGSIVVDEAARRRRSLAMSDPAPARGGGGRGAGGRKASFRAVAHMRSCERWFGFHGPRGCCRGAQS